MGGSGGNGSSVLSVLMVERDERDHRALGNVVRKEKLKYTIHAAENLDDALDVLSREPIDIVLYNFDISPRKNVDLPSLFGRVPVIIMTDLSDENVIAHTGLRGAYDYVIKDLERSYVALIPSRIENVMARWDAEQELRASEARYLDLFDNAPDMYFLVNFDGSVLSVNKQGAAQLGYTVDELVGEDVFKVVHPDDREVVAAQIQEMVKKPGSVHSIAFRKVRKDGSMLHVAERITVLKSAVDAEHTIRIICRDISERIELEAKEKALQERLARSERLESMAVLAGGVAHDLNNILGPLVAYPDLIVRSVDPDSPIVTDVMQMKKSALRAVDVIQDLLTLSHRGRYDFEPVDVNSIIQTYSESAGYRKLQDTHPRIKVGIDLGSDLKTISASETHVVKILLNLVKNAFEAMGDAGDLLIQTLFKKLVDPHMGYDVVPPGEYTILRIKDSGQGIPAKDRERIFEPFYTKKKFGYSGSGLGLAIVYGVVQDLKSYIDVKSSPNKGAEFTMYFPALDEAVRSPQIEQIDLQGTEHILVVDDVPEQRNLASRLLTQLGYRVDAAESGTAALAILRESHAEGQPCPYQMIILDMIMEDSLDGLDTFMGIREMYSDQKCVIASGFVETDRVKSALELGVGHYVKKPYTVDNIGRVIRSQLDRTS